MLEYTWRPRKTLINSGTTVKIRDLNKNLVTPPQAPVIANGNVTVYVEKEGRYYVTITSQTSSTTHPIDVNDTTNDTGPGITSPLADPERPGTYKIGNDRLLGEAALNAIYAKSSALSDKLDKAEALTTYSRLLTNRIALLGDSITNQNSGDSGYEAGGYFTYANTLLGGRFTIVTPDGGPVGEFGKSGITTDQILSQGHADDAANSAADWVLVFAGTNDSPYRSASTIAADLLTIWRKMTAKGKRVIACTILPRAIAADGENIRDTIRDANRLIRSNARSERGVVLCDWYATMVDPATGKTDLRFAYDEIHPNATGASRMGKVLADVLASITPNVPTGLPMDSMDKKSLMPNPFSTGNTNGLGTSIASYAVGAGTYTVSKVTRTDGIPGDWQQLTVTGAANPKQDGGQLQQQNTAVGVDWAVGDKVFAVVEFETDAANWNGYGLAAGVNMFGASSAPHSNIFFNSTNGRNELELPIQRMERGIMRTPTMTVSVNTTRLQLNVVLYGTGTVRIGRWDIFKV